MGYVDFGRLPFGFSDYAVSFESEGSGMMISGLERWERDWEFSGRAIEGRWTPLKCLTPNPKATSPAAPSAVKTSDLILPKTHI